MTIAAPWWWAVDREKLSAAERTIFDAGEARGITWGLAKAPTWRMPSMVQRDEYLGRRIVALLLEHQTRPLARHVESYIERERHIWERAEKAVRPGPMPTYAECMASWTTTGASQGAR